MRNCEFLLTASLAGLVKTVSWSLAINLLRREIRNSPQSHSAVGREIRILLQPTLSLIISKGRIILITIQLEFSPDNI